jgi:hypothetical protein
MFVEVPPDDQRIFELTRNDFPACSDDCVALLIAQHAAVAVRQCGSPFTLSKSHPELQVVCNAEWRNSEVFYSSDRVDAIQFLARNGDFTDVVRLSSSFDDATVLHLFSCHQQ